MTEVASVQTGLRAEGILPSTAGPTGPGAGDRAPLRRLHPPSAVGIGFVIAAGLAVRVFTLTLALGSLDADEATTGLIARHFLHTREVPVFHWGVSYGGTIEPLVTAAVFAVVGPSVIALKVVAAAWYAAACVLTWRVGRRLFDERTGVVAALLMWVWPSTFVWWSLKSRGFYGSLLVLGLIIALCTLRIIDRPTSRVDWIVMGFALGLGWWDTPQIAVIAVPVGAWLLARRPCALLRAWLAVVPALLGAAPWIIWNVRHGFASFDAPPSPDVSFWTRFLGFWKEGLPEATGLRVPYSLRWIAQGVESAYPLIALVLAVAVIARYRIAGLIAVATVVVGALVYAMNPLAVGSADGRYLYVLSPVVALIIGACLSWRRLAVPALAGAMVLTCLGLSAMHDGNSFYSSDKVIPIDLGPLIRALDENNVRTAVSDYGIAYRVDFESQERIIVAAGPPLNRYKPYLEAVSSGPPPAWIFVDGSTADQRFTQTLQTRLEPFRRITSGGFAIYLLAHRFVPGDLPTA